MLRMALLGAGFIGGVHAENLAAHPDVDLTVIHDPDTDRARQVADRTGARVAPNLDAVFSSGDIDAVLIASSTTTHAEYLHRAASAGLAVLCEKPIDLSLATARDAATVVTASGIPAMVDFNRRFDPDYGQLQAVVAAGGIGSVELVQMSSRGPSLPPLDYLRVSGGQLRDQTVHFFDLLRWITGDEPVAVHVAGAALSDPRVAEVPDVDTSVATLTMASGALCQIDSIRRSAYGYDERIEVFGSGGLVEARRQPTGFLHRYGPGRIESSGLAAGWFERMAPTYARALDAFVTAIRNDTPPSPSLADGLRAQAIAEAATESLRTGHTVTVADDL